MKKIKRSNCISEYVFMRITVNQEQWKKMQFEKDQMCGVEYGRATSSLLCNGEGKGGGGGFAQKRIGVGLQPSPSLVGAERHRPPSVKACGVCRCSCVGGTHLTPWIQTQ